MRKATCLILILLSLLSVCAASFHTVKADSKTLVVPDDFPSIIAALGNATDGDTVFVKRGVYHEHVKVNVAVSLVGEDRDTTVIDGNPPEGFCIPIDITHDNVTVTGFTLRDGYAGVQMGNVKNCNVSGNSVANTKYGITIASASNIEVSNNVIASAQLYSYGIYLSYTTDCNVLHNRIGSANIGIRLVGELFGETSSSLGNSVSENEIINSKESALMIGFSKSNIFLGNNFTNSGRGVNIFESDNNAFSRNNFINNTVQATAGQNEPFYNMSSGATRDTVADWSLNYWSDYTGKDANYDTFGDTPYVINAKNSDNQPLMQPHKTSTNLPDEPALSTLTPAAPSPSESATPFDTSPTAHQQTPSASMPASAFSQTEFTVAIAAIVSSVLVVVAVSVLMWKLHHGKG